MLMMMNGFQRVLFNTNLSLRCTQVYSRQLKWLPVTGQEHMTVAPIHPNILLARLNPGQEIDLLAIALKGTDSDSDGFGFGWM